MPGYATAELYQFATLCWYYLQALAIKHIVNDEICVALSPIACLVLIAYDRSGGFLHFVKLIPIWVLTNFFAKILDWEVIHSMSIGGRRGGCVPHFTAWGGQHWKCPHTVSVHTTNLKARLITRLSYKLYIGLVVKLIQIIRVQI